MKKLKLYIFSKFELNAAKKHKFLMTIDFSTFFKRTKKNDFCVTGNKIFISVIFTHVGNVPCQGAKNVCSLFLENMKK